MNNISDKLVTAIILVTVLFVFALIFVKSPERKVIDSPIMWKDDFSNIAIYRA